MPIRKASLKWLKAPQDGAIYTKYQQNDVANQDQSLQYRRETGVHDHSVSGKKRHKKGL